MNKALLLACLGLLASCVRRIPESPPVPAATPASPDVPAIAACKLVSKTYEKPLIFGISALTSGTWRGAYATIALQHPAAGVVLLDPGIPMRCEAELSGAQPWFRWLVDDGKDMVPTRELLKKANLNPDAPVMVLVTHAHWDHIGAAQNLTHAALLMSKAEVEFVDTRKTIALDHGVLVDIARAARPRMQGFEFDGPAFEGFAASHDMLGDGSIVAVPLPGHTPGSTGYFVNAGDGRKWLFIGDASFTVEGVKRPEFKNLLASVILDEDAKPTGESLATLHALFANRPDVTIVPAHDLAALDKLPNCGSLGAEPEKPAAEKPAGDQAPAQPGQESKPKDSDDFDTMPTTPDAPF